MRCFPISNLPCPKTRRPIYFMGHSQPGNSGWWLWGIRKAIRETGAELFHGTNFEVPYMGATPAVMTIHDLSPWLDPAWHSAASRVRKRTPWLVRLRRARIILTVSEAVRREVIDCFEIAGDKVSGRDAGCIMTSVTCRIPARRPSDRSFSSWEEPLEPRKNLAVAHRSVGQHEPKPGADLIGAGRRRAYRLPGHCDLAEGSRWFLGEIPDQDLPRLYVKRWLSSIHRTMRDLGCPCSKRCSADAL